MQGLISYIQNSLQNTADKIVFKNDSTKNKLFLKIEKIFKKINKNPYLIF
jgi:hypothetical protein